MGVLLIPFSAMVDSPLPWQRPTVQSLLRDPSVQAALSYLAETDSLTVEMQVALTEIPAPPFQEAERARYLAEQFRALGLKEVWIDEVGNVVGYRPGAVGDSITALAAHLDTVFPEGTPVRVSRQGGRLEAPGISDNGRGLAVLLAVLGALETVGHQTQDDLLFVGTVGEEGLGDLRGIKHLFLESQWGQRIHRFVALDGAGLESIANGALGSRRFRITFRGPGGHSWSDFGLVNPAHALGRAVAALSRLKVPKDPRTTFNVGRIGGGTSINAIPSEAWFELDLRSTHRGSLERLEATALAAVRTARDEEAREGRGELSVEVQLVGDRPSGLIPADDALVRLAVEVTEGFGVSPQLEASSTDANLPISLGIPAIRISGGGRSGGQHSLQEWYENTGGVEGVQRALLILLGAAGLGES